jgi:serine/threonine protein kinase
MNNYSFRVFGEEFDGSKLFANGSCSSIYTSGKSSSDLFYNQEAPKSLVKIVHPKKSDSKLEGLRFLLEAYVGVNLNNSEITMVEEFSFFNNSNPNSRHNLAIKIPYMGTSLIQTFENYKLKGKDMPLVELLNCFSSIAYSIHQIHSRGIINRDIKPDNIVGQNGNWHLIDFGISKVVSSSDLPTRLRTLSSEIDELENKTGFVSGTLHYMPKEQINLQKRSFKSDIYSFSVTLFNLLTNKDYYSQIKSSIKFPITCKKPLLPLGFYTDKIRDEIFENNQNLILDRFGDHINDFSIYGDFERVLKAGLSANMNHRPNAIEFANVLNSLLINVLKEDNSNSPSISHETHFVNSSKLETLVN